MQETYHSFLFLSLELSVFITERVFSCSYRGDRKCQNKENQSINQVIIFYLGQKNLVGLVKKNLVGVANKKKNLG